MVTGVFTSLLSEGARCSHVTLPRGDRMTLRYMNWALLESITGTWGRSICAPKLLPEGTSDPTLLLLEGTGVSTSLVPCLISWEPVEGHVALLADLRWKRPFGLHRAGLDALPCGDLKGVRKADVFSSRVWSGDSCPFPVQPIWWGPGDVPPTETKDSYTQMPPGL